MLPEIEEQQPTAPSRDSGPELKK
jgi:hypothetical protein